MSFDDPATFYDESAPPMGGGSMISQLLAEAQQDPDAAKQLGDFLISYLAGNDYDQPPEDPAAPMDGDEDMPAQLAAAGFPSPTNVAIPGMTNDMTRNARNGYRAPPQNSRAPGPAPSPPPARTGQASPDLTRLQRRLDVQDREIAQLRAQNEQTRRENISLDRFSRIMPTLMEIHHGDEIAATTEADQIIADTVAYSPEQFEREVVTLTRLARAEARPSGDRVHQNTQGPAFFDPSKPLPQHPGMADAIQRFSRAWQLENGKLDPSNSRAFKQMQQAFKNAFAKGEIKL